jgi:K+-sensing histidine kinase KdpD
MHWPRSVDAYPSRMTTAADRVPGGVLSLSADLQILEANRGLGELIGRPPAELVGQPFDILLSVPSRILFQTHVYPAMKADGLVEEVFLTLASSGGETVPVLLNAVRSTEGEATTYEALVVRIRARARWENDLLATTRALEQEQSASRNLTDELRAALSDLAEKSSEENRNRAFRDAFAGVVSHELQTPITTIYGMSHLLRERYQEMEVDALGEHLYDIHAEADRLRRLTENLLVLSRAESGRLSAAAEPIAIAHVVRRAVESERSRAPEHAIELEAESGLPIILGEESYIEQVVANFLGNAVKYSPAGSTIRVVVEGEAEGVTVRVIDQGAGIAGDQQPERLFDLFFRAPGAALQAPGAGIGLFICRELIKALGGRIWAAPAPPPATHGAEFGFWIPAGADESADMPAG